MIIDHGVWSPYEPASRPSGAPPSTLFFRNAAGDDWYEYREATWPLNRSTMSDASDSLKIVAVDGVVSTASDNAHGVTLGGGGRVLEAPAGTLVEPRWLYDEADGTFSPAPVPVPEITKRQLRLWLVRNGIALATVEAAIDAMPEPARTEAQIEWNDASVYSFSNPLVIQIGAAIGLTDPEMLKQAFRDAALI